MNIVTEAIQQQLTIPDKYAGKRLDQVLAELLPAYSRSQIKIWIDSGELIVNKVQQKPRYKISGGEEIELNATVQLIESWAAQDLPLNIIYEDQDLLVINKPVGLVVHPGAGTPDNTLANALLFHYPELKALPRAGLVHRLDRDTSGLMVVAKTEPARLGLIEQLQTRTMSRIYQTITVGVLISGCTIETDIGRHPKQRIKMAVLPEGAGKPAITHVRVTERFKANTLVQVQLETGRTHQIRVHLAHKHYPVLGDQVYGQRLKLPANASDELITALREFQHQALHAAELSLVHPVSGKTMTWQSEPPEDMLKLIELLRDNASC